MWNDMQQRSPAWQKMQQAAIYDNFSFYFNVL